GLTNDEPHTYSLEFNAAPLEQPPVCHICWKPIENLDDAAIAQVYWRTNDPLPKNARLDHRFCHKSRK
ncbi:MAG: hypothetical protein ACFB0C_24985, partial [Leptolyngbyaceae cyanobacterium]